jgi:ribosomal protein S18 acetylase RimI-like enzyme
MGIIIQEINRKNAADINKCDGEFIIDARLVLNLENDRIRFHVENMTPVRKRYQQDQIDPGNYQENPNQTIFFAYMDGQLAGQVILRKNWNNFAYVEDIVVDLKFRRRGIGKALILQAKKWARERRLAGIMLETQNNNVGACKLYEHCGFQLAGLDRFLYKGLHPDTYEIALYWYWLFEPFPPNPEHTIDELVTE